MGTKVRFLKHVHLRTKAVGLTGADVSMLAFSAGQEAEVDEKALKYIDEHNEQKMYEKTGSAPASKAKSKGGK